MGPPNSKLLCFWLVLQSWSRKHGMIPKEKLSEVKGIMLGNLRVTDEIVFRVELERFKFYFPNDEWTKNFGQYFVDNYVSRVEGWAFCFRMNTPVNTNNHLENMNR